MPKHSRKRKHVKTVEIEYEVDEPKAKFRPIKDESHAVEEENMSQILFGGSSNFLKSLEEAEREQAASNNVDSGVGETDSNESDVDRKPAWIDEDDDGIDVGTALQVQQRKLPNGGLNKFENKYSSLLKNKFKSIVGTPKWASLQSKKRQPKNDDDTDSDEEILRTCGFIAKRSKISLPAKILEFKKVRDLNCETYTEGPFINAVEFHSSSSVGLIAGNSGIASLFAVDGRKNTKLHSVAFEKYPIFSAKFINSNEALFGSRFSHIFAYDLNAAKSLRFNLPQGLTQFKKFNISIDLKLIAAAGKFGEIYLMHADSKEKIAVLKQDTDVTALTFSNNLLYSHSSGSEISIWDLNTRRLKHRFHDEGCLNGSALDISSSNQFLASGSAQGVVNLYKTEDIFKSKYPKPLKVILNLTTAINQVKFNSTSELLAFSSADIPNSVKLFHLGSQSVFSNFPTFDSKLGNINCLNFSPGSGYFAFGNRKSTVALYRLKHFKSY